jgi:hypothetical protein
VDFVKLAQQRARREKAKRERAKYATPNTKKKKEISRTYKERKKKTPKIIRTSNIIKNIIKKATVKPLTAEQIAEVKNSLPGPMQKLFYVKIYTCKNKAQHERSMFHLFLEDRRYAKQQEKKHG